MPGRAASELDEEVEPSIFKRARTVEPRSYMPRSSPAPRTSQRPSPFRSAPLRDGSVLSSRAGSSAALKHYYRQPSLLASGSEARTATVSRSASGARNDPIPLEDDEDYMPPYRESARSFRAGSVYVPRTNTFIKQERDQSEPRSSTPRSNYTPQSPQSSQASQPSRHSSSSRTSFSIHDSIEADDFDNMPPPPLPSRFGARAGSAHGSSIKKEDSDDFDSDPDETPSSRPAPSARPLVTPTGEQQEAIDLALSGANVFYTGSAGSGKSTILKFVEPGFRAQGKRVQIVAPTGKAALDVGGRTTWMFAGWAPSALKEGISELERRAKNRFSKQRMQNIDVLIIDEISMVENWFFERLNRVLKIARENNRPFGGLQLIVTGDFCQLPPVKPLKNCFKCGYELETITPKTEYSCDLHGTFFDSTKWAFCSDAWKEANFRCIHLKGIHRQEDERFKTILEKRRLGKVWTEAERDWLENHPCDVEGGTQLFSSREEVKHVNNLELQKIRQEEVTYFAEDFWKQSRQHHHLQYKGERSNYDNSLVALDDHNYDYKLRLKKGMRVVLLTNIDIEKGLVNGSQGTIISFAKYDSTILPRPKNIYDGSSSLDGNDRRERIVNEEAELLGGSHAALQMQEVKRFMASEFNQYECWPRVRFDNGQVKTIVAHCAVEELGNDKPYSILARTQIPLAAAWAMTIHKSQGMTLDKVIVDLSRAFEQGQVYVALSRARTPEGLKVLNLGQDSSGGCNPQVKEFLKDTFPRLDVD